MLELKEAPMELNQRIRRIRSAVQDRGWRILDWGSGFGMGGFTVGL